MSSKRKSTTVKPNTASVYEVVSDKIVAALESGKVAWQMPWSKHKGLPQNLVTKHQYQGANLLMLWLFADYDNPYFVTMPAIKAHEAWIKKGEHGHVITAMFPLFSENNDGEKEAVSFRYKYFYVWNISQLEKTGTLPIPELQTYEHSEPAEKYAAADKLIGQAGFEIRHSEQQAYYSLKDKFINMPARETFQTLDSYYRTAFHEIIHAEIDKERTAQGETYERTAYAQEELVAEIGAAFLSYHVGIEPDYNNSAAYLQGWSKALKDNPKWFVSAAAQAQKIANRLIGVSEEIQVADVQAEAV